MLWRLGLVGFDYPEWAGTFYPRPLAHGDRLAYYAARFNAVELNTTFYAIPTRKTVRAWADAAPASSPGFVLCPKLTRDVTHGPTPAGSLAASEPPPGHLIRPETAATLRRWLDAVRDLGAHLGPILIQFPPRLAAGRAGEMREFLSTLPRDLRYAVEFRHRSWSTPDTAELLAHHGVAWVSMDQATLGEIGLAPPEAPESRLDDPAAPHPVVATADFLYARFLGRIGQFTDRTREHVDPTARLAWWGARLRAAAARYPRVTAIYAFFDNNLAGFAPATAVRFAQLVGLPGFPYPDAASAPADPQGQLFGPS